MNPSTAILEGLIDELNVEWRGSDFYFYKDGDAVACSQKLSGKSRDCLGILIDGDAIVVRSDVCRIACEIFRVAMNDPDSVGKLLGAVRRKLRYA